MGSAFNALAAANVHNSENQAALNQKRRETFDLLQKQFLYNQNLNAANSVLLPPQQIKDPNGQMVENPAYQKALNMKANYLKSAHDVFNPEQHATLGERIHGLIFGEPQQENPQSAAQPPASAQPSVAAQPPGNAQEPVPQGSHPFAHNPAYAEIQKGLEGLGNHLKAFAHPLPPQTQQGPNYEALAAAPSPEQAAFDEKMQLLNTQDAARIAYAKALAGDRANNTYQKQFLNTQAERWGKSSFADLSPDQQGQALAALKKATASTVFKVNPATGYLSTVVYGPNGTPIMQPVLDTNGKPFGGPKPASVRISHGFYHWTDESGNIHQIPITTESTTMMRPYMAPDSAHPNAPVSPQAPVSKNAPSLDSVNQKIQAANDNSKKINHPSHNKYKAPRSSQAPNSTIIGHTASLLDKSAAAQYTKLAEDANNKEEMYQLAKQGLENPTASSDQQLVFDWVRSNVQGAGKMTGAEYKQARGIGSWPMKIQTAYYMAKEGRLSPKVEQELLADIQRSAMVANQMANKLKNEIENPQQQGSSQAPAKPLPKNASAEQLANQYMSQTLGGG